MYYHHFFIPYNGKNNRYLQSAGGIYQKPFFAKWPKGRQLIHHRHLKKITSPQPFKFQHKITTNHLPYHHIISIYHTTTTLIFHFKLFKIFMLTVFDIVFKCNNKISDCIFKINCHRLCRKIALQCIKLYKMCDMLL